MMKDIENYADKIQGMQNEIFSLQKKLNLVKVERDRFKELRSESDVRIKELAKK